MSVSSKSFIILLCFLALHTAGAQEKADGQVPEAGMVSKKVDFVHETSIFDVCYAVFRALYTFDDEYFPLLRQQRAFIDPIRIMLNDVVYTPAEIDLLGYISANRYRSYSSSLSGRGTRYLRVYRQTMLRDTTYDEAAAKALLVSEMEDFRDTAAYLPTLYAVIEKKYGGDVARYVDHLYRRAILIGRGARLRFRLNPSQRRMKRDAGFQFVLSRMLYRLWEALGRPDPPVVDGMRLVIPRSELEQMASGKKR